MANLAFRPHTPTVLLDDTFDYRESNARALKPLSVMEALKCIKKSVLGLHVETLAIVSNVINDLMRFVQGAHFN